MFIHHLLFAFIFVLFSRLIYSLIKLFSSKISKYPHLKLISLNDVYSEMLVISAMDKCVKFIPDLKYFSLSVLITPRPINVNKDVAGCGSIGNFLIRPFIMLFNVNEHDNKNDFIKIFIHELFHTLGFGCHKLWLKSIIIENNIKYLSLKKFPHTRKFYGERIKLSDDGNHLHEEYDDEVMQVFYNPKNRITILSLLLLKDLGNKINFHNTNDKYFNIKGFNMLN